MEVLGVACLRPLRDATTAGLGGVDRVDSEGLCVFALDMKDRKPLGLLPGLQRTRNIPHQIIKLQNLEPNQQN